MDGANLLSVNMQLLERVGEMGGRGHNMGKSDLLRKVEKEKLLNGIRSLREGTHLKPFDPRSGSISSNKENSNSNSNFELALDNTKNKDDNLRFSGVEPEENPIFMHSVDEQTTDNSGECHLLAPAVGSYVIRCFARGYFSTCSEIIKLTQPRKKDGDVVLNLDIDMFPKLRKVRCVLFDPQEGEEMTEKQRRKTVIGNRGSSKYRGIPVDFIHTDSGSKYRGTANAEGVVGLMLPPGTYALSVDMQVSE